MMKTLCAATNNSEDTEEAGFKFGTSLKGGEVIELSGDLGAGKTTFTRGLARGISSYNDVSSPSFTISRVYIGETLKIHHYDFYRLDELGLMEQELEEVLRDTNTVVVIEWAGNLYEHVSDERLIKIEFTLHKEDLNARYLKFSFPDSMDYLVKGSGLKEC